MYTQVGKQVGRFAQGAGIGGVCSARKLKRTPPRPCNHETEEYAATDYNLVGLFSLGQAGKA